MRKIFTQGVRAGLLLAVLGSVVACAGAPVASEEPVAAPIGATDTAPAAGSAAPAASTGASDYAELPQSKTPAGYYLLGEPTAPVLMQFYSDFL